MSLAPALRVDARRFLDDFEALSAIGATPQGGVTRPAFSPAHLQARTFFRRQAQEAGLEFSQDAAGNHSALLRCGPPGAQRLLLGSHLDSVVDGGRYDGALGVLAALEVLRTIADAGLHLPFDLEAVDFSDEEGVIASFLGSFAATGRLTPADLQSPRGGRAALLEGLARAGLDEAAILSARRDPATLAGYLEMHIEQGPLLEAAGVPIGVVQAICGIAFLRVIFHGQAGHAATVPIAARRDAALGAAGFILDLQRRMLAEFPLNYYNVGQVDLYPGLFNVVPARASLAVELRFRHPGELDALRGAVETIAAQQAGRFDLEAGVEWIGQRAPGQMDARFQQAVTAAAAGLGLASQAMVSGPGHDAQSFAGLVPTGMVFIPCRGGVSHSPLEYATPEACLNGANVLLQTVLHLAR